MISFDEGREEWVVGVAVSDSKGWKGKGLRGGRGDGLGI